MGSAPINVSKYAELCIYLSLEDAVKFGLLRYLGQLLRGGEQLKKL